jgi:hypothetical protein
MSIRTFSFLTWMHIYVWATVKVIRLKEGYFYAREMFIKMGKARLLYYFGTWLGLHTFPCFTADSDILIVQMRLFLSTCPQYSRSQIQAVPWDPLRIQQ